MVRKKIDNRIRILIENCVISHHRSFFIVVGENARDNVVILHEMLSKAEIKARPTVLWCYKKDLGFATDKKKRRRIKKARLHQKQQVDENDSFEYFIASTNIRYCYYSETQSILGQTFGMAILQDFEAITPNLLARTIETVEGGGMIIILLQTLTSLKQLYTMAMDVHARYRTEAHQNIICRFNERFILSLPTCDTCIALDDKLNILPISSNILSIKPLPPKSLNAPKSQAEEALIELKSNYGSNQPIDVLVKLCKTLDQANAVLKFMEVLGEKTNRATVTLTSARGRGKSAAMGLAIAGAIAYKYTNIFVTSPHPENLKTLFKFLLDGLNALGYEKMTDYEEVRSSVPEFNKAVVQVNVTRKHRQTVKYIDPSSSSDNKNSIDLVVIDEAAAIPLPLVKKLFGPYVIFMASTINGYEGTGRSLSLKLIKQIREQSINNTKQQTLKDKSLAGRILHEITLEESIRYANGDQVEDWLNRLLCLDVTLPSPSFSTCPSLDQCKLYYINRDTLFSYNKVAEKFLRKFVAILVASHYKNSPNDLLVMSDAPAHHIFCLCAHSNKKLPEVLCVIQLTFEGKLSENIVKQELARGRKSAGDLIPWSISKEYEENDFPSLSGARIVRIATHPDYQRKGYALHALKLLEDFFEGHFISSNTLQTYMISATNDVDIEMTEEIEEKLEPRTSLPPLFSELNQVKPEILDYIGVSFGVSHELLKFWKKAGYIPLHLTYTPNQLTGEHSCIMLKQLKGESTDSSWLSSFWLNFCENFVQNIMHLEMHALLPLNLITSDKFSSLHFKGFTRDKLTRILDASDIENLEKFVKSSKIKNPPKDIIKTLCILYFSHHLKPISFSTNEERLLFSIGLLMKSYEEVLNELDIPLDQANNDYRSALKKLAYCVINIYENEPN